MRSPRRFFRPPAGPALAATLVAIAVLAGCAPTSVGADREAGPPSSGAYDIVPEPGRTIAATPPSAGGAQSLAGYRIRSEERREGKERVSTCMYRWSACHSEKKNEKHLKLAAQDKLKT